MTLSRIYTRTGDGGDTALGGGARVPKHDARVESYGAVDEANAAIGAARAAGAPDGALLSRVQNDLFDLGADLCRPEEPVPAGGRAPLRVTAAQVAALERAIDRHNSRLKPLRSFVLPGGGAAAAHLHVARTVTRRAERRTAALAAREAVNPEALKYLNRLSDLLFVLARRANNDGADDVLWEPGRGAPAAAG